MVEAVETLPEIILYPAKEIVTLDPAKPTVQAVAVVGDRILETESLDELKAAAGQQSSFVTAAMRPNVSSFY